MRPLSLSHTHLGLSSVLAGYCSLLSARAQYIKQGLSLGGGFRGGAPMRWTVIE